MIVPPVRIDPELGRVRRCRVCREEWPADQEFFRSNAATCRACRADLSKARPIPLTSVTHGKHINLEEKRRRDRERKAALRRDPVLGDKLRARQREAQRRHYEKNRLAVLERHRISYAAKLDRPIREGFGRPRFDR